VVTEEALEDENSLPVAPSGTVVLSSPAIIYIITEVHYCTII
jgi:hypothetical protein